MIFSKKEPDETLYMVSIQINFKLKSKAENSVNIFSSLYSKLSLFIKIIGAMSCQLLLEDVSVNVNSPNFFGGITLFEGNGEEDEDEEDKDEEDEDEEDEDEEDEDEEDEDEEDED